MKIILLLLILIGTCFGMKSQHFIFDKIGYEQGMPDENLLCVFRDRTGILWIGSGTGLIRYNSYDFKIFKHNPLDSLSICNNTVYDLAETSTGKLWVATENGVCILNKERNQFKTLQCNSQFTLCNTFVNRLCMVADEVWIASANIIFIFDLHENFLRKIEIRGDNFAKNFGVITAIRTQASGDVWVSGLSLALLINHKGDIIKSIDQGHFQSEIFGFRSILEDPLQKNICWSCTSKGGIFSLDKSEEDKEKQKCKQYPQTDYGLRDIAFLNDTTLIAIGQGGLVSFNTVSKQYGLDSESNKTSFALRENPFDVVNKLLVDSEGIVWITTGVGLAKINPSHQFFTSHDLLSQEQELENLICPDEENIYCIAHHNGIRCLEEIKIKTNDVKYHAFPQQLQQSLFNPRMCDDGQGKIWIGGFNGLYAFNKQTNKFSTTTDFEDNITFSKEEIHDILLVEKRIIICTANAFILFDQHSQQFHKIPFSKSKSAGNVYRMAEDEQHRIIMTHSDNALLRLDVNTSSIEYFEFKKIENISAKDFTFISIAINNSKTFLGTLSHGIIQVSLDKYDWAKTIEHYDARKGVHSSIIQALVSDEHENIWAGGRDGLCKIAPNGTVKNYNALEGLGYNLVQQLYPLKGIKKIFALIPNVIIDPMFKSQLPQSPTLIIEEFILTQKNEALNFRNSSIELEHFQNAFKVVFCALDYFNNHHIHYRYKLEGLDTDWIEAGYSRTLNYASVPPGNYHLHIEATDETQIDRKNSISISIKIIPALYQTIWFRSLCILMLLILVFFIAYFYRNHRFKMRLATLEKEKAMNDMRINISHDIHDDIGAGLTLISLQGQSSLRNLKASPEKAKLNMENIVCGAQELTQNLSEIIWSVNPIHDNLESFVAFIRSYCANYLEETTFQFEIRTPPQIPVIIVNPDWRRNIFMVLKEALHNAVKYCNGTQIDISIICIEGKFELSVKDNGIGMEIEKLQTGNGFITMQTRANKIKCQLIIETEIGVGTDVRINGLIE